MITKWVQRQIAVCFAVGCAVFLATCTSTPASLKDSDTMASSKTPESPDVEIPAPSTIRDACRILWLALDEHQELPDFVLSSAKEHIDRLTASEVRCLVECLQTELYLILPNVRGRSKVEGIGTVPVTTSRSTRSPGPNFIAAWYTDGSVVKLVELDIERKAWPEDLPPLLRYHE